MERSRREFLTDVGRGMVLATVGLETVTGLGMAPAGAAEPEGALAFGRMESLVCLMQETSADALLPALVAKMESGTSLKELVAAAALANARSFGGEDYIGFHTMMALSPAYRMAGQLTGPQRALPVFKVLYRNSSRIQEVGGRRVEVLKPVAVVEPPVGGDRSEAIRQAVRRKDRAAAEGILASSARSSAADAFNDLLPAVLEQTEVHRVVLPYRAWDLLDVVGQEHAHTMLRQSVRYCLNMERHRSAAWDGPSKLLTGLFDRHGLLGRAPGTRLPDDAWVDSTSMAIFRATPDDAAGIAAAALAEGVAPDAVGEAISLAANQLVLRDMGRPPREEAPGKPVGSVHGDSIGVHASDSANAWRGMAKTANAKNTYACIILGAYQVALDRAHRGGDFLNWQPVPLPGHVSQIRETAPDALLKEAETAIRGNLQARAAALVHRYGELGHPAAGAFDLLLRYAVSEDGSLHAEKYYRTACEEFASSRPAFRWRHVVALARVTASEFGRPAPGYAQACRLLKI